MYNPGVPALDSATSALNAGQGVAATGRHIGQRPWLALTLLFLTLAVVAAVWVSIDRRPAEWDHANHLERALRCSRNLAAGDLKAVIEESSFYPPLVPCAAGVLYFVAPVGPLSAQSIMVLFLGVGLVAIFLLARRLWDAGTGLLAAFFFATAPFVVLSLTNFQLDLPLAAMVVLTLYGLHRAEDFGRTDWASGFGLLAGLGMLTKPTFLTYVLPAVLWVAWRAWRRPDRRPRLARLGLGLLIASTIALPWYGPRLIGLPFQVVDRSFNQAAAAGQVDALTAESLLFYPRVFQPQFGLLAGLLCVWGLWAIRRDRASRAFVWWATLGPLVIYALIQNKNLRYTLPLLPAAALVAAFGVRAMPPRWRPALVGVCVVAGALQVSMAAFALPQPPMVRPFLTPLVMYFAPSRADWQHGRILDDLARLAAGRLSTVSVVPNYNFLSVSNLRYEGYERGLPIRWTRAWHGPPLGVEYIILKTGSQGPSFSARRPEQIMKAFDGEDPYLGEAFPIVGEYALPDGSRALLRARRLDPVPDLAPAVLARRLQEVQTAALADYVRDAVGLRVTLQYRPDAILKGEVDRLQVEAEAATVGEHMRRDRAPLRVRDVRITVDRLLINPRRLVETGALEVLDADALRIERLRITQGDLDDLLRGQPVGRILQVELLDRWAAVSLKGFPLSARVGILTETGPAPFALKVEDLRAGGIPIPDLLVNWVARNFDPTLRARNLPVAVSLGPVRLTRGAVEVGAPEPRTRNSTGLTVSARPVGR